MENQEIINGKDLILREEATLSPEKEQEYIFKISELTVKNTSLEEEVADLRQQLALMKKALHGQKSEKTEVIMEKAEQLTNAGSTASTPIPLKILKPKRLSSRHRTRYAPNAEIR